ncbi:hypothetical protein [Bacillus mycoides]|uniref:hypothetical protein n=1 Tax=Bacillus mycoides TaxID=1405 RepID=UPI00119D6A35|nr:hypothetical protein [Bacillus mycoides]
MTTISQNVIDTLVVGIYEDVQMLVMMMMDYEEEMGMVTKKEIITAHENLNEVILFCQSHSQGMNVLLMEEVRIGIKQKVAELFGKKTTPEKSNTIYGEKLLLPEGIFVQKKLDKSSFQYLFYHETLGEIGRIIFPKEEGNIMYFDVQLDKKITKNSAPAQILKNIGDMLQKEILRPR